MESLNPKSNGKKTLIWIAVVVLLVVGLEAWLRQAFSPLPGQQKNPPPSAAQSGQPRLMPSPQLEQGLAQEREREAVTWGSLLGTPISFYGKVIDEKSGAIRDADVEASFVDNMSGRGGATTHLKTDTAGLFHISGRGLGVSIRVNKAGYYRLKQSNGVFAYAKEAGQTDSHPDPSAPAIFILRKMGNTAPLIVQKHNYSIGKNGVPVMLDLKTGKQTQAVQGDIKVQAWTNDQGHPANSNEPYDWRVRIEVPGGGLLQRSGAFDFEAPSSGYLESDEIEMLASFGQQWRSQAGRDYFLKLANGTYARLEFRMVAGGSHFFSITSFLNPTPGDQNTEYNPSQQPAHP